MDVQDLLLKITEPVACGENEDNSQKLKNQENNSHECYKKTKTISTILPSPLVRPGSDRLSLAKTGYANHVISMSFSSISLLLALSYSEAGLPPTLNAHCS